MTLKPLRTLEGENGIKRHCKNLANSLDVLVLVNASADQSRTINILLVCVVGEGEY